MGANSAGGDYNLENSLRFRSSASAYLSRTPTVAGNRKTFTISLWMKGGLESSPALFQARESSSTGQPHFVLLGSAGSLYILDQSPTIQIITTAVFRDPSAWYHVVVAIDTTEAIAADRAKIYVNGEKLESFSTLNTFPLNYDTAVNNTVRHLVGARMPNSSTALVSYLDGYLTEVNFVDGQALTASDFGDTNSTTGVWQPIEYEGTYGTNGFYLKGRGTDNSGNGNNWTENNFNTTNSALTTYDIMTDVPTLTDEDTANYAVMNPLDLASTSTVISNGNLKVSHTGAVWNADRATMGVSSGKWYWEVVVSVVGFTFAGGVMKTELAILNNTFPGNNSYPSGSSFGYYFTGSKYGGGLVNAAYGASYTNGDTIGTALDLDAGTITFYKNGVSQGVAWTGLSGEFAPSTGLYNTSNHLVNFGQQPFRYTPPTGHLKLNTFNLPDSSIVDGSEYFDVALTTGTGSGGSVTGIGFSPDFVWTKNRNFTYTHGLVNSVVGGDKLLQSSATAAEATSAQYIQSFNSDGFTFGNSPIYASSTRTYAHWMWRGSDSAAVSNTDGTITSQVSANPTAGFSVVKYTGNATAGATVGHGLSSAPKMMIVKNRDLGNPWLVYHQDVATDPATDYLVLNTTAAKVDNVVIWNDTAPTASVFSLGSSASTNGNGTNLVAYCFASVEGYSKFGSYTGNGSTNGPFVYTGFRPAFVMVKTYSSAGNWFITDAARDPDNVATQRLFANLANAEDSSALIDLTSNGFKLRMSSALNDSANYIYMAFAENPFKNSLAR